MRKPDFIYGGRPNWTLHELRQCQEPQPDSTCNYCGGWFYEDELRFSIDAEWLCEECGNKCLKCEEIVRADEITERGVCHACEKEAGLCNTGTKGK